MLVLPPLTADQMSNMAGSMSVAAWLIVYTPQLWENYQLKSGEGLSVSFIILWLLGDLTNLFGAILANLIPTTIVLAIYYAFCDIVLLFQVYYYRRYEKPMPPPPAHSETSPLLESSLTLDHPIPDPPQPKPLISPPWLEYPLLISIVLLAGAGAWFLSSGDTVGVPERGEVSLEWRGQLLGYISAVLYLGSRVPQIIHNTKTRCAGLSLALFFFSITGNVTYLMSILLVSTEPRYILANASWLAGSGLTVFLDLFVMAQFAVFSYQDKQRAREAKIFRDAEGDVEEEERA